MSSLFIFERGASMPLYSYNGPVKLFDQIVSAQWKGSTIAPSEKKARSNLAYQYKKETRRSPASKISLPGDLVVVE